jgi:formate-dependent nitrite reductase cytochrome c552 subunit
VDHVHGKAFRHQRFADERGGFFFVFDYENMHRRSMESIAEIRGRTTAILNGKPPPGLCRRRF